MKAIVQDSYGPPDVFKLREIPEPVVKDRDVLVRVRAASIHAGDCYVMRGRPPLLRLVMGPIKPRNPVPGFDVAGTVEAVGEAVALPSPGDDVFGWCTGALAEYARARHDHFVQKPAQLSFEQAAAVPTSGFAALHGIRDAGKVRSGQKVLINGASGGVGSFAVQIANALGAEVTGVCSTANVDMVRSIGADHVVDYTQEDFSRGGDRYDLILDNVGNHTLDDLRRVLTPKGTLVPNFGLRGDRWTGAAGSSLKELVISPFISQRLRPYISIPKLEDLRFLKDLIEAGHLTPVVDRTYPLRAAGEAMRYLEAGHARGKVVITM